jgi:hypothetical protein
MSVEAEALADTGKDWGAVQVGKNRWYWAAGYFRRWMWRKAMAERPEPDGWLIAEGFTDTREAAVAAAETAQASMPGDYFSARYGHAHRHTGNRWIRTVYRDRHARKPPPAKPSLADLGCLYRRSCYGGGREWEPLAITKVTIKRVFVRRGDGGEQLSFDRATLERAGRAFRNNGTGSWFAYTQAGMEKEIAEAAAARAQQLEDWRNQYWPLLRPDEGGLNDEAAIHQLFEARARELPAELHDALAAERDKALAWLEGRRRNYERIRANPIRPAPAMVPAGN